MDINIIFPALQTFYTISWSVSQNIYWVSTLKSKLVPFQEETKKEKGVFAFLHY